MKFMSKETGFYKFIFRKIFKVKQSQYPQNVLFQLLVKIITDWVSSLCNSIEIHTGWKNTCSFSSLDSSMYKPVEVVAEKYFVALIK